MNSSHFRRSALRAGTPVFSPSVALFTVVLFVAALGFGTKAAQANPPSLQEDEATNAPKNIALLVAISDYGSEALNLRSPAIDVELVASTLQQTADFDEVIRVENPDRAELVTAIQRAQEAAKDGVMFFYYSGHAISVDGENFLIPTGAHLQSIEDVGLESVSVRQTVNAFRSAKLRIIVLDACRTNPFGLGGKSFGQGGLAREQLGSLSGTIVSYAAAPGSIAYDGMEGEPSPFTRAFVRNLRQPGLDLPHLFMTTRGDLAKATAHLSRGPQRSEEVSSLTGDDIFRFVGEAQASGVKAGLRATVRKMSQVSPPAEHQDESFSNLQIGGATLASGGALFITAGILASAVGTVPLLVYLNAYATTVDPASTPAELDSAYATAGVAKQQHEIWGIPLMIGGAAILVAATSALALGTFVFVASE